MSMLSPRLQLKVAQKQILTPGLVQMVTVLQLNRLELKDMITQEIAENPVLEEAVDGVEELTPEEVQAILESERTSEPTDQTLLDTLNGAAAPETETTEQKTEKDPFDEIDFGTFFDEYLDPGYKSPASESVEKPSFETFLSSPVTLSDHLHSQLALVALTEAVRDAAEAIIGNLNENGYLMSTPEESAASEGHSLAD